MTPALAFLVVTPDRVPLEGLLAIAKVTAFVADGRVLPALS